jgi:hypothetical protein
MKDEEQNRVPRLMKFEVSGEDVSGPGEREEQKNSIT